MSTFSLILLSTDLEEKVIHRKKFLNKSKKIVSIRATRKDGKRPAAQQKMIRKTNYMFHLFLLKPLLAVVMQTDKSEHALCGIGYTLFHHV